MMTRFRLLLLAVLALGVLFPRTVVACSCAPSVDGFVTATNVTLPANAVGVPFSGRVPEVDWRLGTPDSSHFHVEIEEQGLWRTVPAGVTPISAEVSGADSAWGESVVLVGPRDGLLPGRRYRCSSLIAARNSVVFVSVSQRRFLAADGKASAIVAPVTRGNSVALTIAGSCATHFAAAMTSIRLELSPELEPWSDALLYVVRDGDGRVWSPDSSLCNRTPPGRNALGPGHERLFTYCGPPREKVAGEMRWGSAGPPQQQLPAGTTTLEIVAWLPGTKERIAASARVTLDCEDPGR